MDEDDQWAKLESAETYVEVCTCRLRTVSSCYLQALTLLSQAITKHAQEHIPALISGFEIVLKRVYVLQRIGAACFFAEVINQQFV